MVSREIRIRSEERSAAGDYLKKAADNYDQMLSAIKAGNFNASATLAIQCLISSADAICVNEKGVRSISQDHFDVCDLVASLPLEEAREKSKLLRKVIARKDFVQYERRQIHESEAWEMVKTTTRFYQWVSDQLGR